MNPFLMFLLAILSPLLLFVTLFAPIHAGLFGAAYLIYDTPNKPNPLMEHIYDPFYMVNVYTNLFNGWMGHIKEADVLTYTLPLIVLPLLGIFIAVWLTGKTARKLKDIFQLGASM